MNFENINRRKIKKSGVKALTLFQKGKWKEALPLLQKANSELHESVEISAVLGICELFSSGILEPDNTTLEENKVNIITDLLNKGESTNWPEVLVCKSWIRLLQNKMNTTENQQQEIDLIVNNCEKSNWFPVWALMFRMLAHFDQRHKIKRMASKIIQEKSKLSSGMRLIIAEAFLECGVANSIINELFQNIDYQNCMPLTPEVSRYYHIVLKAEYDWWEKKELNSIPSNIIKINKLKNDFYSFYEYKRLNHIYLILEARYALSQNNLKKLQKLLELASHNKIKEWEIEYLKGLTAWTQRDMEYAGKHLSQSLELNPFQSRIAFEHELIKSLTLKKESPKAIVGVYDTIASSAAILSQKNKKDQAIQILDLLNEEETPYSLRLICPEIRLIRIIDGWKIKGYHAEMKQNWTEAFECWEKVRNINTRLDRYNSNYKFHTDIYRTRQLYLLSQYIRQNMIKNTDEKSKNIYIKFQKELGKLSISKLYGDALFYRSLAAEPDMPDLAIKDWQALLTQKEWLSNTKKYMPNHLLYIGDKLFKAGYYNDAKKAYLYACETSTPGAKERLITAKLLDKKDVNILNISDEIKDLQADKGFWLFIQGLYLLTQEPSNYQSIKEIFDEANNLGLSQYLSKLSNLLLAFVFKQDDLFEKICSIMNQEDINNYPDIFQVILKTLHNPEGIKTLQQYKQFFGDDWQDYCPISAEVIVGLQIRNCLEHSNFNEALAAIKNAESLNVKMPIEWKIYCYLTESIELALGGNFTSAYTIQGQIQKIISLNIEEGDSNGNNI